MDKHPLVMAAVLNYNGEKDSIECIRSIQSCNYPHLKILIIDNGSRPDSVAALRTAFPQMECVETHKNLGYAGGNNVAMRIALEREIPYCLILNNDTTIAPDMIGRLVDTAQEDDALAVIGPQVYRYEEPETLFYPGWKIDWEKWLFHRVPAPENPPAVFDVDYVQGCGVLFRTAFLRGHGLFDEDFFLYCEDADICVRAQRSGFRTVEIPAAKMWHKGYASSGKDSPLKTYYGLRNRLLFIRKHAPRDRKFALVLRLLVFDARRQVWKHGTGLLKNPKTSFRHLRAICRALWDHWRKHYGQGPKWLHK
ncbi:MAG: glycosyltransferase family 2 protein [Candidatus Sumerlaeia bacterium]